MKQGNRMFAVLGFPLAHTMSPPIHQRLFELDKLPYTYVKEELSSEKLEEAMPRLLELEGFNITIPHKVAVIPYLDEISPAAERYGAVNCVHRKPDGKTVGYNTDVDGFLRSVQQLDCDLSQPVCVVGSGGAGRMFAIESALRGAEVTLAVRAQNERTEKLKADILSQRPDATVKVVPLSQLEGDFELLINATPVGMYPHAGTSPVKKEILHRCRCVFDAVYNPTQTALLQDAQEAGCRTVGGMAMLVWQAVAAHEIWDGSRYSLSAIQKLIADMVEQVEQQFNRQAAESPTEEGTGR